MNKKYFFKLCQPSWILAAKAAFATSCKYTSWSKVSYLMEGRSTKVKAPAQECKDFFFSLVNLVSFLLLENN